MASLTCERIEEAVRQYNDDQALRDDATRNAVEAMEALHPSLGRFLAEVCLVADWGSIRLDGFPFADRLAMAEEINKSWDVLRPIKDVVATNWNSVATAKLLAALFQTQLPQPPSASKRQLVFVSKYLHWCVNPEFALLDGNSQAALGKSSWKQSANVRELWAYYSEWMGEVGEQATVHQSCLEGIRNNDRSIVRTLDKALYIIGSEHESDAEKEPRVRTKSQNAHGQFVVRNTGKLSSDRSQSIYQLVCLKCGHNYGAQRADVHTQKCPNCQNGEPGLAL